MVISKHFFPMFTLLFLTSHFVNTMEPLYPQIQLNDHEDVTVIIYYAMVLDSPLSPYYDTSIKYATQSIHTQLNLPTTIKDPLMTFKIVEDLCSKPLIVKFKKVIPLKHTFNLNDGSLLTTVKKTGAQLYPNDPLLKDKQFLIKIICAKNPKLEKKSFAQDRHFAKEQFFYKEASIWVGEKDNIQELIDAEIIKKKKTERIMVQMGNEAWQQKNNDIFGHGPQGIANDEALRQSIIAEKIPLLRQGFEGQAHTSCFKALRQRELTGSFRK
jgi:hypothetical protein